MTPEAANFLRFADTAIYSAEGALRLPDYPGFIISRAYYAMFYAATALLQSAGQSYNSHSAVLSAFGRDFAHPGKVPGHLHSYILNASRERNLGDYDPLGGSSLTAAHAAQAVENAKEFVREAAKYLQSK